MGLIMYTGCFRCFCSGDPNATSGGEEEYDEESDEDDEDDNEEEQESGCASQGSGLAATSNTMGSVSMSMSSPKKAGSIERSKSGCVVVVLGVSDVGVF